jgi:hypothetical protein
MQLPKSWIDEGIDEKEIVHLGGKPMVFNPEYFNWDDDLVNALPWDRCFMFGRIGVYVDEDDYVVYVDLETGPEYRILNRGNGCWKFEQDRRFKLLRNKLNLPTTKEWIANWEREEKLKGCTNFDGEAILPLDNSDLYGRMSKSSVFPDVPISADEDPYSGENVQLTQLALDRYRNQNPQALYHLVVGAYPVPDFLNEIADAVVGIPFWEVEIGVGQLIHSKFGESWDIVPIRSYCLYMLSNMKDPLDFISSLRRESINSLQGVVNSMFTRVGAVWVKYPTSPFPLPLCSSQ